MPTKEQPQPQPEGFPFTERERLFYRVSDRRFQSFLADPKTTVYDIQLSTNTYGEFLFVSMSYPKAQGRDIATFFGLGFHDYRERWIAAEWFWYDSTTYTEIVSKTIPYSEARRLIEQRRAEIAPHLAQPTQSAQGILFEILADVFDEDGAWSEMQDLDIWVDDEEE